MDWKRNDGRSRNPPRSLGRPVLIRVGFMDGPTRRRRPTKAMEPRTARLVDIRRHGKRRASPCTNDVLHSTRDGRLHSSRPVLVRWTESNLCDGARPQCMHCSRAPRRRRNLHTSLLPSDEPKQRLTFSDGAKETQAAANDALHAGSHPRHNRWTNRPS